jgi:type IV pilus assembly protein PilQ
MLYPKDNFFDFVQSVITSSSTKVLASPTLILSENQEEIIGGAAVAAAQSQDTGTQFQATIGRPRANESFVTVGEQVVTNYTQPEVSEASGTATGCEATFGISGLTFGARVSKIDDNGFVTFTMSPQIAATTRTQRIEGCGDINILSIRRLDTGSARVRDGQTLILTGVISDSDRQVVSKWPILGDLPFLGQFFRGSAGNREKRELVIMVTPRIIDDSEGGSYGYGYQPSTREARQFFSGQNAPGSGY